MSALGLREVARATGGEIVGQSVLCPGPGHGPRDRSLSVKLSPGSPLGFVVFSHAGDDFAASRDHVAARLGIRAFQPGARLDASRSAPARPPRAPAPEPDHAARIARAVAIWNEAGDAHGTVVETYLASRGLMLPDSMEVLRFNPSCPWRDEAENRTIYVPAMIAAMRSIETDAITGIHRTRLTVEGAKVDRRMIGIAAGAAVKIDADDAVTGGLNIGEGIETAMTGCIFGLRPAWALGSAAGISSFPVLAGLECLTILAENDPTNAKAIETCARRWHAAGREVVIVQPKIGSDLNDALRGAA